METGLLVGTLFLFSLFIFSRLHISLRLGFAPSRQRVVARLLWGKHPLPWRLRAPKPPLRMGPLLARPRLWGGLVGAFWHFGAACIRASHITRLEGSLRWGIGLPAATGLLVAPFSSLVSLIMRRDQRLHLTLIPDFTAPIFHFQGSLTVTLPLWKTLWPLLRFVFNPAVRRARALSRR